MPDMPRHPNARGSGAPPRDQPTGRRAWWVYALGVALVALLLLMVVAHLTGMIGPGSH